MISGSPLLFSLFNKLAIWIVLVASYGVLNHFLEKSNLLLRQTVFGIIFGGFAVVCMFVKIPVYEGVIVDQRNTIVALSGAFGGPLSAIFCAIMTGSYRFYLGGGGTFTGIIGGCSAAVAGIGLRFYSSIKYITKIFNYIIAYVGAPHDTFLSFVQMLEKRDQSA